jgi:hypothetical protein
MGEQENRGGLGRRGGAPRPEGQGERSLRADGDLRKHGGREGV